MHNFKIKKIIKLHEDASVISTKTHLVMRLFQLPAIHKSFVIYY